MKRLLLVLLLALPTAALADSPLTSTDLTVGYEGHPAVEEARSSGQVEGRVLQFLIGPAPNDQKAAVINALGWDVGGKGNGLLFVQGLAKKRGKTPELLKLKELSASDRFVLGYLLALDDYFELKPLKQGGRDLWGATPQDLLAQAAHSLEGDFAVHYVRALVEAQASMETSWCAAYLGPREVLDRFPRNKRNMKPEAVRAAQSYLELYADDCGDSAPPPEQEPYTPNPSKPPPGRHKEKAERLPDPMYEVYDVDRLWTHVAAGTQGGLVIWKSFEPIPIRWEEEFICSSVVVLDDVVWAGCDSRVISWDTIVVESWLPNTDNDAEYYALVKGPGGALFAFYGGRSWRWDPRGRAFNPVEHQGAGAYHALYRSNGEFWWIDFLSAIHGPKGAIELSSETYPGRDPRRFREDALGTLWVEDFEGGLYRYDDGSRRFVHHPGLTEKGTGVAIDVERERTWLLHYTKGLVLQRPGRPDEAIDLSDLGYMRDIHLDPDGTVWVAGWGKMVRIRSTGKGWERVDFAKP